ncbi:MAG: type II secretion system minor pseudopilin GspH [Woeseiaceae bacterium]
MGNRRYSSGFTLIEILVVVSVMAIIVSIALLSLGVLGDDRQLREEARRVGSLLQAAQDEAIMQGREFGLEVMRESYRFVEYDPYELRWLEMQTDDIFRYRQLPGDIEFDLLLEDKIVLLSLDAKEIDQDDDDERGSNRSNEAYAPHIMIFSSGESTPFELRLVNRGLEQIVILEGDVLGQIEIMTLSEQEDALR